MLVTAYLYDKILAAAKLNWFSLALKVHQRGSRHGNSYSCNRV